MAIEYKYLPQVYDGSDIRTIIGEANNPHFPGGIIDKLCDELSDTNPTYNDGDTIYVPILPPFFKKHDSLVLKEEIPAPQVLTPPAIEPEPEPEPEPVFEEPPTIIEPEPEPEPEPVDIPEVVEKVIEKPVKQMGNIQYKLFPYTFARPGDTIEAVIRLYNDMSVSRPVINKLVYEFSVINQDALPPVLGQTVQVPVLLPFVYRHVNENKIFKDNT